MLPVNCFYGLKEEHNIDSFAEVIYANQDIRDGLRSTDSRVFDSTLCRFISQYMDDGHSLFSSASRFGRPLTMEDYMQALEYYGLAVYDSRNVSKMFSAARSSVYPDGVPMYEEIGDTAFITFDSFYCRPDEDFSQYYNPENEPDPSTFVIREQMSSRQTQKRKMKRNPPMNQQIQSGFFIMPTA